MTRDETFAAWSALVHVNSVELRSVRGRMKRYLESTWQADADARARGMGD